jgi:DNA-binding CsgD family transcriptional regulator
VRTNAPLATTRTAPVPPEFAPYLPPALADVNVPAYVLDSDGRCRWLNAAAMAIAGDAVGRPLTDLVDVDPRTAQTIFERRLAGLDERDHSVALVAPGGERTRVEISSVPLESGHRVVGMFGLAIPVDRKRVPPRESPLTPRQQEVLELLAEGASTTGIAQKLFLSEQTVRNHVREILRRLGARSRLAAVAAARRAGLI